MLAQLLVVGHRVDPVGRDELRRDPAGAHRLEHVRVVVRDEVERRRARRSRGCRRSPRAPRRTPRRRSTSTPWPPKRPSAASSSRVVVDPGGVERAGAGARLEDQRVADRRRRTRAPRRRWSTAVEAAVGTPAARSASFIDGLSRHSHAVRTDVPGDRAVLPDLRGGHGVRLDRRLEPVDPDLVLDPADGVGHHADVDDGRDLVVVRHPALELVVEPVRRATRRCR